MLVFQKSHIVAMTGLQQMPQEEARGFTVTSRWGVGVGHLVGRGAKSRRPARTLTSVGFAENTCVLMIATIMVNLLQDMVCPGCGNDEGMASCQRFRCYCFYI